MAMSKVTAGVVVLLRQLDAASCNLPMTGQYVGLTSDFNDC